MHKISSLAAIYLLFLLSACAGASKPPPEAKPEAARTATVIAPPTAETPVAAVVTKDPATAASDTAVPEAAVPEKIWRMKKGKLEGATLRPAGNLVAKVKNKKGNGFTNDICYDYGSFAIFETKSSDEVGSAEIYVRHKGDGSLCAPQFKGVQQNLKIREGSFAGVAGDYVVTEGSDASEFLLESQIFSLNSGEEILRVVHDPGQEYMLALNGPVLSVTFHSKVSVKCELPTEGVECWKNVLAQNKLPKSIKMPDCKPAFEKSKTPLEEPALVTVKSRIRDVRKPKIEFLVGSANCAPEP